MDTENTEIAETTEITENKSDVKDEEVEEGSEEVEEKSEEVEEKSEEVDEVVPPSTEDTASVESPQTADNPFAYLDRNEFTSEKFKIEIRDLPKYYGMSELKKLINTKLKLSSSKIKAPKNCNWAYICFRNEEDKTKALNVLNGFQWKGKQITASVAKPMPDPLVKKRKENSDNAEGSPSKKPNIPLEERIKNSTTPYWNIPYEEQVEKKNEGIKKVLVRMGKQLCHANPKLKKVIEENEQKNEGLPCEYWDMRSTEKINGYRNKCEYTIGMDPETKLPTVGFRLGSYVTGNVGVAPPDSLVHIPDKMKAAAKVFEKFVRGYDMAVFDPESQTGHFRTMTCKYAATSDELMIIIGVQRQQLTTEEIDKIKKDLVAFFSEGEGTSLKVTSLYYQSMAKRTPGSEPNVAEHLWGDTHIHETILDLKFAISPEAFFQTNTEGAEVLYESAIELASPTQKSTVVDICCGTGTIGLCFAQKCKQVLGIEIVPQAIEDAKQNAKVNNIENCEFFAGKAEEILSSVMFRATQDDIIAIVDPPRSGLHQKAIQMLRRTKKLNKLVYIACDAAAAMKNFIDLGRAESKTLHGNPLIPKRAVSVDMFPYTQHCELLIFFERMKQTEAPVVREEPKVFTNLEFIQLLKANPMLLLKTKVPELRKQKTDLAVKVCKTYSEKFNEKISTENLFRKINHMKIDLLNKVKMEKFDKKKVNFASWEIQYLELLEAAVGPLPELIGPSRLSDATGTENNGDYSHHEDFLYPFSPRSRSRSRSRSRGRIRSRSRDMDDRMSSDIPRKKMKRSPIEGYETLETVHLTDQELQRLILLEQLKLLRMQQKDLLDKKYMSSF